MTHSLPFNHRGEGKTKASRNGRKSTIVLSSAELKRARTRRSSKKQFEKRKAAGMCAYFGCPEKPKRKHVFCKDHLTAMLRRQKAAVARRKAKGLCIYCGERPQFWGVRCVICRQRFWKSALPVRAQRALRKYREAEAQLEVEQLQAQARFAVRKLLLMHDLPKIQATALRLYAGLDDGRWRTNLQVAQRMRITRERVRQLLYPSKVLLERMLGGKVPWKPVPTPTSMTDQERSWREPRWTRTARKAVSRTHANASATLHQKGVH